MMTNGADGITTVVNSSMLVQTTISFHAIRFKLVVFEIIGVLDS